MNVSNPIDLLTDYLREHKGLGIDQKYTINVIKEFQSTQSFSMLLYEPYFVVITRKKPLEFLFNGFISDGGKVGLRRENNIVIITSECTQDVTLQLVTVRLSEKNKPIKSDEKGIMVGVINPEENTREQLKKMKLNLNDGEYIELVGVNVFQRRTLKNHIVGTILLVADIMDIPIKELVDVEESGSVFTMGFGTSAENVPFELSDFTIDTGASMCSVKRDDFRFDGTVRVITGNGFVERPYGLLKFTSPGLTTINVICTSGQHNLIGLSYLKEKWMELDHGAMQLED